MLAFALPISLKLALDTVFPGEKTVGAFSASHIKGAASLAQKL